MYKKIVTVIDVVGEPRGTLKEAIKLSKRENAELHLLIKKPDIERLQEMNYLPYDSGMYMPYEYDILKETDTDYQKDADEIISKVRAEDIENLVTTIFSGDAKNFTKHYIKKNEIDLVVVSTGDDLFSKRELESVAKYVIKETESNLLILK